MAQIPKTISYLSVDDSPVILSTIKENLESLGVTGKIFTAEGVDEAIRILEREKVNFIISDWNMPGKTGLDFLAFVRTNEKFKNLPFLMLTTQSESSSVITAITNGVSNYLIKPWTIEALVDKISKSYEKHSASNT